MTRRHFEAFACILALTPACSSPGALPGPGPGAAASAAAAGDDAGDPTASGAGDGRCARLFDEFDETMASMRDVVGPPGGAAAAVKVPGCGVWSAGFRVPGDDVARDPAGLLRFGSVTKTFTAAATLLLVADGRLTLEDRLGAHVEGFPNGDTITIRQLLDHTSGARDYVTSRGLMARARQDPGRAFTPRELIDAVRDAPPLFEPGTDWQYSNTNYTLLGMVIEAASGQQAAAFIRDRLLEPHGLAQTYLEGSEPLPSEPVVGYDRSGAKASQVIHPSVRWTSGAVVSTARDIARWGDRLYRGEVLPAAMQAELLRGVPAGAGGEWGAGARIWTIPGIGDAIGHGGAVVPAYHSVLAHVPSREVTVVSIVNTETARNIEHLDIAAALIRAASP